MLYTTDEVHVLRFSFFFPSGKITVDEKSKAVETEVKKNPTELKTVPNEAPQTNGNESKA